MGVTQKNESLEILFKDSNNFTLYNYYNEDNLNPSEIERPFGNDKDIGWLIDFKRELFDKVLSRCSFKEPDDWEDQCDSPWELSYAYETNLRIHKDGSVSIVVSEYWYSNSYVTNYQEGNIRDSFVVKLTETEAEALMNGVCDYLREHNKQMSISNFAINDRHDIKNLYNFLMVQTKKAEKNKNDIER